MLLVTDQLREKNQEFSKEIDFNEKKYIYDLECFIDRLF